MATKGHLVIIGGGEDREDDKVVLGRVIELSGGEKARVVVLTTASRQAWEDPQAAREYAEMYDRAFKGCGAQSVEALHVHDRHAANDPAVVKAIDKATCVFMTGGDQSRLVSILGGTGVAEAMHRGYNERGMCIAGTSAGASAISVHMVLGGPSEPMPRKGLLPLAPGLGFLPHVLIDQHFSERQRLGRLLSVVAQNPFLIGVGIDEDTALVVSPNACLEVIGGGGVTLVDGRDMDNASFNEVGKGDVFALTDVRLHLLPAGFTFELPKRGAKVKEAPTPNLGSVTFIETIESVITNA